MDDELHGSHRNEKTVAFLEALSEVCRRYGLSLGHEDREGGFQVEPYNLESEQWLLDASELSKVGWWW